MPRVHFVKASRKKRANIGVEVGDSYYWAQFKTGPRSSMRREWKEKPKPSQLTLSEFLSTIYGLQENTDFSKAMDFADLEGMRDDVVAELETLRDEQEEKRSNMPEGLQESDTGQLLQERYDGVEEMISNLQNVDLPSTEDARADIESQLGDDVKPEDREEAINEQLRDQLQEKACELQDALDYGGS